MAEPEEQQLARILPLLRYRDVGAASDWLNAAFGFEILNTVTAEDGGVLYAELRLAESIVMLVPVGSTELDQLMRQPDEIGGAETQSCYIVVADAGAHAQRARMHGADIVLGPTDDGSGKTGYTCRDLEGHLWSFGTYDPAARLRAERTASRPGGARAETAPRPPRRARVIAATVLGMAAVSVPAVLLWPQARERLSDAGHALLFARDQRTATPVTAAGAAPSDEPVLQIEKLRADADRLNQQLNTSIRALQTAREQLLSANQSLSQEVAQRASAEQAADTLRRERDNEATARKTAEQEVERLGAELAREKKDREAAARSAEEHHARFIQERETREALEREMTADGTGAQGQGEKSTAAAAPADSEAAHPTETGSVAGSQATAAGGAVETPSSNLTGQPAPGGPGDTTKPSQDPAATAEGQPPSADAPPTDPAPAGGAAANTPDARDGKDTARKPKARNESKPAKSKSAQARPAAKKKPSSPSQEKAWPYSAW